MLYNRLVRTILATASLTLAVPSTALAHGTAAESTGQSVEGSIASLSLKLAVFSLLAIVLFLLVPILTKRPSETLKRVTFWSIVGLVVGTTFVLAASTIWLNVTSWSGGPIHWHADYQVWACGRELDLVDPEGFVNRVGSGSRHEHGDQRIHFEGVVFDKEDAELSNIFRDMGVTLTDDELVFPTNEGEEHFDTGDACPDGTTGEVQVFLYKTDRRAGTFHQEKLSEFTEYMMTPEGQVPPGDCLVIEFAASKEETEHLCASYEVAEEAGQLKGRMDDHR